MGGHWHLILQRALSPWVYIYLFYLYSRLGRVPHRSSEKNFWGLQDFLHDGCTFCYQTNIVKALKESSNLKALWNKPFFKLRCLWCCLYMCAFVLMWLYFIFAQLRLVVLCRLLRNICSCYCSLALFSLNVTVYPGTPRHYRNHYYYYYYYYNVLQQVATFIFIFECLLLFIRNIYFIILNIKKFLSWEMSRILPVVLWLVAPHAPTSLKVTNVQATRVLLRFVPGFSGHTFISPWVVEAQRNFVETDDSWTPIYSLSDTDAVSITVPTLRPHTAYRLRLIAVNIAGRSPPSAPTAWFHTLQAAPSTPPTSLIVRPLNETALLVRWTVCWYL